MMALNTLFLCTALFCSTAGQAATPEPEEWDLSSTWGLVVGVLSWEKDGWSSFSDERRQDALLFELLRERGMPAEQGSLLLDEAATLERIEADLTRLARAAEPGSTLIFYYAGHGQRVGDEYYFANFDMAGPETGLSVDRVGEILRRNFRGRRVLLFADCCHSGSLRRVVDTLAESGIEAACVTSVVSACVSTGNWTFTQTLLEGLRGDATLDENGDGLVALEELGEGVFEAMACRESQKSGYSVEGLDPGFAVARTKELPRGAADSRFGEHVVVRRKGRGKVGKVVGVGSEGLEVRVYSYSDSEVLKVGDDEWSALAAPSHEIGVSVRRGRQLGAKMATVVRRDGPFHWVEFRDFPELPGEWVHGSRLRRAEASTQATIFVEWHGDWYPATILETDGERTRIHYTGYDDSWDEWVPASRLRRPKSDSGGAPDGLNPRA